MKSDLTKINKKDKLYVLKCGDSFSCYGFDVVERRTKALGEEMKVPFTMFRKGTRKAYNEFLRLREVANVKNKRTGWRSQSDLYKPFIGNEGRRVEVVYKWGEKERFYIGKSTGFIPCHIMVKQRNSNGGGGVLNDSIKSYRFIS